ncbi:MAG: hypothetical protein H2038_09100 [Brevundimonas sp.]|uniref:KGGVGR-motif variant AAA ATPase n=1 Tax=Brevundimonas sp. TaxID=1871086 RepID=UPI0017AEA4E1|nr:hypothetical protein [Brevundimonas sp.]MBA4804791.1 hypothetical protein [Brevundimonas sp.]
MAGRVTTFYSFKGGNGRSMAMANVAWALATNGEKVLAIDWDLEAPGLHRYFHPFLRDPEQSQARGLVDHLWNYVHYRTHEKTRRDQLAELADASVIVQELELPLRKSKGLLHFIGAGRQDDEYSAKVGGLDWATFYGRFGGEAFLNQMMGWARSRYTHILIDSRTGVADTAGVCTTQLPDGLVLFLVYNRQSIDGTAAVAKSIMRTRRDRDLGPIDMLVCPSRVEERGTLESARRYAVGRLAPALQRPRSVLARELRRNEIRHYPWCAFEEKLAVFEDEPDERGSLLDAMHVLAGRLGRNQRVRSFEPVKIDPETIARYWRRAAFDDPRLAELEELSTSPASEVAAKLAPWLEAALDQPEDRTDWLASLAEACVERSGSLGDAMDPDTVAFLSDAGMELARIVYEREGREFRIRFSAILQNRSDYLQQIGNLDEALASAEEAASLLGRDKTELAQWRHVRALERVAALQDAIGASEEALRTYREMVTRFDGLSRRALPLGGELEGLRARRLLAQALFARRETPEALAVLEPAVRRLPEHETVTRLRDSAEIATVLGLYAEIAMAIDVDLGRRAVMMARGRMDAISETRGARASLERRLALAEAEGLRRTGRPDQAMLALEALDDEGRRTLAVLESRAAILLDLGRADEAQTLLFEAISRTSGTPSNTVLDLIERAVRATGEPLLLMELALGQRGARRSASESAEVLKLLERAAASLPAGRRRVVQTLKRLLSADPHGRASEPDA